MNIIAEKFGIKLIEDACHAFGASYQANPIGSHSDFACFSFQAIKQMTTVDGGALVCKSAADCRRGKLLRWYGIDRNAESKDLRCQADIREFGYKFHMNDVTAVIGLEQLKYVSDTIAKHRANAARYNAALQYLQAVRPLKYKEDRLSAYWLYTVRVKDRPRFFEHMREMGITVSQVHVRNDDHTMFRQSKTELPGVDEYCREQISIPVGWWLTPEQLEYIIDKLLEYDQQFN